MAQRTSTVPTWLRIGAWVTFCLLLVGAGSVAAKDKHEVIERFTATAMDLDSGRATIVNIGIFGWNTDEDRLAMIAAFNEGGNRAVYKHLSKQKEMAFVRAPNTIGYQMRYAYQYESEGKRHIILGTDRPISGFEIMHATDSRDNSVSFVTLDLDKETGKGTGIAVFGAEFKHNKKTGQLEIETISMNPTKFTSVETEKVKHKD